MGVSRDSPLAAYNPRHWAGGRAHGAASAFDLDAGRGVGRKLARVLLELMRPKGVRVVGMEFGWGIGGQREGTTTSSAQGDQYLERGLLHGRLPARPRRALHTAGTYSHCLIKHRMLSPSCL